MSQLLSPCCEETIYASRDDGVWVGSCSDCHKDVLRINPRTGVEEWLDGASPWTDHALRPVARTVGGESDPTPRGWRSARVRGCSGGEGMMGQNEATDLPPTAQKALRVLDRDGQVTEQEMIVRLRPAYPESVRSVIRQLTEAGLTATNGEGMIRRA